MTDIGESGVLSAAEVYLVEMYPLDRGSPPVVTGIYLSTRDVAFPSDPYAPTVEYDGCVIQALSYRRELWGNGLIGGRSIPSLGSVTIAVDDDLVSSGTFSAWRSYAWDGYQIRVLRGEVGDEYAEYDVLLDGLMSGVNSFGIDTVTIGVSDLTARLDRPVHTQTYAGTGGFEGGADLAGASKGWGVGIIRGVEPQPIGDPNDLWFDVDPINGLDPDFTALVEDGGVAYTDTPSNPPDPGKVYVDYAAGRVRVGTAPTNKLTVTARSAFGSTGSPMEGALTASRIIEALLLDNMGFVLAELDTQSFTDLETANSAPMGRWWRNPPTALEAMDLVMNSIGGYYTTTRGGLITLGLWSAPTANAETDNEIVFVVTDEDLVRGSARIEPVASPPNRIEIGWGLSHTVLAPDDFSGAATEARREFLGTEYRYAIEASTTVEAEHLLSEPMILDTMLDEGTGAAALALRLAGLYAVGGREAFVGRLQLRPFSIEPAQQVWVRSMLLDVDMPARLYALGDDQANPLVEIRGWR